MPKGPAIKIASSVVNNVINVGNQTLAWFLLRSNLPEKRMLITP